MICNVTVKIRYNFIPLIIYNIGFEPNSSNTCEEAVENTSLQPIDLYEPQPEPEPSDDEYVGLDEKKSIPDEILLKMFNTGVSFRTLSEIIKLTLGLFGAENSYHLSSAYLFQRYKKVMQSEENTYRGAIENEKMPGTICFDHQSMKHLNEKHAPKEDRLAIVWHSNGRDNLLAVEKMNDKSGYSQSEAIERTCESFQIGSNQIVALSCDNASTNIGQFNGTCITFENAIEKDLLRTNCRHHIYEIVIKDVYRHLFESATPTNAFFPILKEKWMSLRARNFPYEPFDENSFAQGFDDETWQSFQEYKTNALTELRLQANSKYIRDDYKESNNVCLKFLGEHRIMLKRNQVEFRALIDSSNARFMASLIQGIECYLFREELDWESPERQKIQKNLERFAAFAALVYIRFWNRCNILFDSTYNDLYFLQELQQYAQFDEETAQVAMQAINRHLYYMSQELSVVSLFSEKVSTTEKNRIAVQLIGIRDEPIPVRSFGNDEISNHIQFSEGNENTDWLSTSIHNLIGERSFFLFDLLGISTEFLETDAEEWTQNAEYIQMKEKISKTLICVNDTSERMISLCKTKYKKQRCRNENSFRRSLFASSSKNNR